MHKGPLPSIPRLTVAGYWPRISAVKFLSEGKHRPCTNESPTAAISIVALSQMCSGLLNPCSSLVKLIHCPLSLQVTVHVLETPASGRISWLSMVSTDLLLPSFC